MLSYHKICSRFRFAQTTTKFSGISGQPSRTFHLAERADINSFPVQQSPEEGPCESAISEDICGLAKGRRDLIVGSSSGGTANPPVCASGAKLSLAQSSNIRIWKTLGRRVTASAYRSTKHAIVSGNNL